MIEEGFKRKFAVILTADVKGNSRLMGRSKEVTVGAPTSSVTNIIFIEQSANICQSEKNVGSKGTNPLSNGGL